MTDTDKELLEFAAKAVNIKLYWHLNKPYRRPEIEYMDVWNPLVDDGDALRVAVCLYITPHIDNNLTDAESKLGFSTETYFNDPYAATRRAIVRAAAEIGKSV